MKPENTVRIKTPEGITFAMPLAGPLLRFFAWAVDNLAILVAGSFLSSFFSIFKTLSPDLASALLLFFSFLVYTCYSMILEWYWQGQTVGKRLFNLRVVDSKGLRLHPSQIIVRNLLRAVDGLPALFLVGGIFSFFSPLCQRLGDMVANTVVIHTPKRQTPDLTKLYGQKFNSLREHPNLVARLRQRISPQEAELGLQAILRRDEFDDNLRLPLFEQLAEFYQNKAAFPDEAKIGTTSEQLVKNVVEVIYN